MRGQDDDSVARILRQIIDVIVEHPHSVQICTAERNGRTSFTVLADVRDKEKLATMTTSIRRLLIAIGSRQRYKYDVLIVTPGHAKETTTKKTSTSEACLTHGPED